MRQFLQIWFKLFIIRIQSFYKFNQNLVFSLSLIHSRVILFQPMIINQSGLSDTTIASPKHLFGQIQFCSEALSLSSSSNRKKITTTKSKKKMMTQTQQIKEEEKNTTDNLNKRKKDGTGLRRLIRELKIENIKRKFIAKLKLNNINSKPIEFQPYYQTETDSFFDKKGIQIYDWIQRFISAMIVFTIIICVFVDTTYIAFKEIKDNKIIRSFQVFSLCCFIFQFFSSIIFVKMVDGKKIYSIKAIFKNYFNEGMLIDFTYLVVLTVDLLSDAGAFRLIILLKLPQCFQRIQKIENLLVNTFYKEQYWGLAKVFLSNFFFAHIICVLLSLMSGLNPQKNWMIELDINKAPWSEQYIWGYYWGTTIMLTVGFGDITPANYQEAICVVLIETFSCLALAYNINCVGNLISNIKSQDIEKNRNIKTFKILSNRNNLTQELQMKIHNYIEESTNIKKKFNFQEESNFISALPRQLKADFLKESNKKIFEGLLFFKNLTEKTMLSFAEVIQMKICHPEQIIKKRGQVAGIMVLKQGKIGLTTKLNGSDFNNITIQTLQISDGQKPMILSLDFLSNDRAIYEVKSEEYSILYYLDRQKAIQCLKTGQLDYEHFCFLRDKARNFDTDFQVFHCQDCNLNHSKFECPKLHYCPLKKHTIDKYLHSYRIKKSRRKPFIREKICYNAFIELQNNLKLFEIKSQTINKYAGYKATHKLLKKINIILERPKTLNWIRQTSKPLCEISSSQLEETPTDLPKEKKIEYQYMAGYLKDEIEKIISTQNEVWLIETDEVRNFKFYFVPYNASTLEYLNRKPNARSIFN